MTDESTVVNPTQEDVLVRGLSEVIGGPVGEHAARPRPGSRLLTPARVVMVLAVLVFCLHWVQKSPCQDGAWQDNSQYRNFCYTDVLALYYAEHLNEGAVPYFDWPVEYPVLTGAFMGVLGLPVHDLALHSGSFNQGEAFYNLNALVLSAFGIAAIATVLALRRRRPWDAAMFALAPALVVTATVNWDLLAVGLTVFFVYAWARRRPAIAGILLGLAVAAKFYPLLFAGPLLVLALRTGRWRAALTTVAAAAATWVAVNAPVFVFAREGWARFFVLSNSRGVDWGTLWYMGTHVEFPRGTGIPVINDLAQQIPLLNLVIYGLLAVCCVAVALLTLTAPRPPRLSQLLFLVVAVFLLTGKVWSQQFVLWLIPLAVLARPRWGAFLAWQLAELGYFLAFYAQMLNVNGHFVIPEGTFVTAAALRWVTVAVLVYFVARDIWRPELDVVRATYGRDPDGGDFNDLPGPNRYEVLMARFDAWVRQRRTARSQPEDDRVARDRSRDPQTVDG
jgi:uncharacterized membrane protein